MSQSLLHEIEILLGISLILSFFSFGKTILFPFQIFTTWVHECCHAVTAAVLGANSIRIQISPDGGGLTHYKIPSGRIRQGMVASAGYVGASLIGCFIFWMSTDLTQSGRARFPITVSAQNLIIALSVLLALSLLFWIRNAFGFFSILSFTLALVALDYSRYAHYANTLLIFLGIQTALNALFDIRILFGLGDRARGGVSSDAHTLQKLFFLPYWFWAFLWLGFSLVSIYWTLHLVYGPIRFGLN